MIGYAVSANYLHILGVEPQLGRLYTNQEDRPGGPPVALLSNSLWRTTFHSDPEIIGKPITLDGKVFTVLGVMPPRFNYPSTVQIWTPAALAPADFDNFDRQWIRILGRLKPGVSLAEAQKAVNAVETQVAAAHPGTDNGNRVVLVPLRDQLSGDIRKPLLLLMASAFLVLLIACANTAGLAMARDAERQKEIAVRLALGATRMRLLRQFVTESLVLAAIGAAIGIPLAYRRNAFPAHALSQRSRQPGHSQGHADSDGSRRLPLRLRHHAAYGRTRRDCARAQGHAYQSRQRDERQ